MGVLQSAPLARDLAVSAGAGPISDAIRRAVREELARHFWDWYHRNAGELLLKRKVLVFSVTIRVRDLYPLFVQLFGEEPEAAGASSGRL